MPAGSEHAVALVKTAVEGASSAAEGMQLAVKQATEVAEAGFDTKRYSGRGNLT